MFNRPKLHELKEAQGRETAWIAKQCGVKAGTVRSYLSGAKNPSLAVVKNMAKAFGVSESTLWQEPIQNAG